MTRRPVVRWEGEFTATHSLAVVNNNLTGALEHTEKVIVDRRDTTRQPARVKQDRADIHVAHQWPPRFSRPACGKWVLYQPWEYGSLPRAWVEPMNTRVDELWVYTTYLRDCYTDSGIKPEKIHVVPLGVDTMCFHPGVPPLILPKKRSFNFLFVGGTIPRKGIDILLDVYLDTFSAADDVSLIIKDFGTRSFYVNQTIGPVIRAAQGDPTNPAIIYLSDDMPDADMPALYAAAQALVMPYRGEGYGLPIAEAMACGLPVIVPRYGACLDYCDDDNAILIPATKTAMISTHIGELETVAEPYWCAVDRRALSAAMWDLAMRYTNGRAIGEHAASTIANAHTWDHAAAIAVDRLTADLPHVFPRSRRTPTICLAMIVRDESAVIDRCLASVKPHIASWVVSDTGSTDDTTGRVLAALGRMPGRLDHDAWTGDFSANRNLVLERAKQSGADYILSIDADEVLEVSDPHWRKGLVSDGYVLKHRDPLHSWGALRLVRADIDWHWFDVFHEYLDASPEPGVAFIEGVALSTPQDGHRSQNPAKFENDMATLKQALADHPDSTRYCFYLGIAYQNADRDDEAIVTFLRRAAMPGGHTDEIFQSLYRVAHLYMKRGDTQAVPGAFLKAYASRPYYAEPLYWLGRFFLTYGKYANALPFFELAGMKPKPPPMLFVEDTIYDYEAKMYTAITLLCLGRQEDADAILSGMEEQGILPAGALDKAEDELIAILPREEAS